MKDIITSTIETLEAKKDQLLASHTTGEYKMTHKFQVQEVTARMIQLQDDIDKLVELKDAEIKCLQDALKEIMHLTYGGDKYFNGALKRMSIKIYDIAQKALEDMK